MFLPKDDDSNPRNHPSNHDPIKELLKTTIMF